MTHLTHTFAALSDDTRFRMVEHLMTTGEAAAGDLAALSDISAPAVSRHLKVLRDAGLVTMRQSGTHRIYAARAESMLEIRDWAEKHRAFWTTSLDRLDALLAEPETTQGEDT